MSNSNIEPDLLSEYLSQDPRQLSSELRDKAANATGLSASEVDAFIKKMGVAWAKVRSGAKGEIAANKEEAAAPLPVVTAAAVSPLPVDYGSGTSSGGPLPSNSRAGWMAARKKDKGGSGSGMQALAPVVSKTEKEIQDRSRGRWVRPGPGTGDGGVSWRNSGVGLEFANDNHEPAGSSIGGRFAPSEGGGNLGNVNDRAVGVAARPVDTGTGGFLQSLLGPVESVVNPEPAAGTAEHFTWAVGNVASRIDFSGPSTSWAESEKAVGDLGSLVHDEAMRQLLASNGPFTTQQTPPAFGPARDAALAALATANDQLVPFAAQLDALAQKTCGKPLAQASTLCKSQVNFEMMSKDVESGDNKYSLASLAQQEAQAKLDGGVDFPALLGAKIQQVLAGLGSMGGKIDAHGDAKDVAAVSKFFPSAWIDGSNAKGPVVVNQTDGRGFYDTNGAVVNYDNPSTLVHELAHRMDYINDNVRNAEYAFYQRRTAGISAEPLNDFAGGLNGYDKSEQTKADSFATPYIGKYDKDNHKAGGEYELMSMGVQSLFAGQDMDDITKDPDYYNFIVGTLAAGSKGVI